VYWAAVERLAGEEGGGLDAGVIPGGSYARMRSRGEAPELYDRIAPELELHLLVPVCS
jgi:DNA gyrase inhibitor GyrI